MWKAGRHTRATWTPGGLRFAWGEGDLTRSLQNFMERGLWGGPQCGRSGRAHGRLPPGQQSPNLAPRKVAHALVDLPGNPAIGGCKVGPAFTAKSLAHPAVPSPLELSCRASDDHCSVQTEVKAPGTLDHGDLGPGSLPLDSQSQKSP